MNGNIRPLLLRNVPAHFFEYDVLRWTVQFKWAKVWRSRFVEDACYYAVFLAVFTAYALLLSTIQELSNTSFANKTASSCLVAVAAVFHIRLGIKEHRQLENYMKDAKSYVEVPFRETNRKKAERDKTTCSGWLGFQYYFRFTWNWVDLASCVLLLAIIVPLHLYSLVSSQTEEWLSASVAIEALVVYAKVRFCLDRKNLTWRLTL